MAPAAGESFGAHIYPIPCSLCHLMYTHTPIVLQQMSQHFQHQSTARILGRSALLKKDYCQNASSQIFRQGGNAWNLLDFDKPISSYYLCGYHKILFHSKRSKPFRGSPDTTSWLLIAAQHRIAPHDPIFVRNVKRENRSTSTPI